MNTRQRESRIKRKQEGGKRSGKNLTIDKNRSYAHCTLYNKKFILEVFEKSARQSKARLIEKVQLQ
eukprot:m.139881 g.139881  ORF g.139881 m.139881 type:complete len:66 (+) comp38287_c1_seq18:1599-1796(+)